MATLLLDDDWDLTVDTAGNLAVADPAYGLAQDAASAIKLFLGELYYDTTQGVPYWQQILGKFPPGSLIRTQMVAAAFTVPGVVAAQCFFSAFDGRVLSGQVQITDKSGVTVGVNF